MFVKKRRIYERAIQTFRAARAGLNRLRKNSFYGPKIEPIRMRPNLESMTCEHGNRLFGPLEGVFL
jgi:hypothetical protein